MTTPGRRRLLFALLLPIAALALLVGHKERVRSFGTEITLPIDGFDPRDLLAGHYLLYQVRYDVPVCPGSYSLESVPATLCLNPQRFTLGAPPPESCPLFLRGHCEYGRFKTGLERFYIPKERARALEDAVRGRKGEITVAVSPNGEAVVKDLLIDGVNWQSANLPKPEW